MMRVNLKHLHHVVATAVANLLSLMRQHMISPVHYVPQEHMRMAVGLETNDPRL